ncbi:MAG: M23 family metallopeptidase [Sphingobium sp.]
MIARWRRWAWAALALLLCVAFAHFCVRIVPADEDAPVSPEPARLQEGALVVPVEAFPAKALTDSFAQARAGGARVHEAIDILAPAGTPVIAAAAGQIEKIFWSQDGGRTVYQRSRDGRLIYYYAHLQDYAPGLREGQSVAPGQRLGRVGSTGNADPAAPHLHFAVKFVRVGERWHEGRAINPYPLLVAGR